MMKNVCDIDWCDRKVHARGFCLSHYNRWRHGRDMNKPFMVMAETPEESFQKRTTWKGSCLIWTGGKNPGGYGNIKTRRNGRLVNSYAHRYAWERSNGPIPSGMHVDHICFNRLCVNIEHLRLAEQAENNLHRKGANPTSKTGVRGVVRLPNGRFRTYAMRNGKQHSFGVYSTIDEAADAVREGRKLLFGEFAGRG